MKPKLHYLLLLSFVFVFSACEEEEPAMLGANEGNVLTESASTTSSARSSGSRGSALSFNGTDQYVDVADDASLDMTDGFTVAAWVYLKSYKEWASVVTKGGIPSDENNYTIHQTGPAGGSDFGRLRFTGSSPNLPAFPFLESGTIIPLNEWHHIAVTYDGSDLTFYFDGQPDGGGNLPGPLVPNTNSLIIGADFPGGDEYWHGAIDEVKIWNVALKKQHIRVAMNAAAIPRSGDLSAHWRFNEGEGDMVSDKSTNGNDGIVANGAEWID